jgi:hypothetical protein
MALNRSFKRIEDYQNLKNLLGFDDSWDIGWYFYIDDTDWYLYLDVINLENENLNDRIFICKL